MDITEQERRRNAALKRMKSSSMNNAKWRKVFRIVVDSGCELAVSCVRDSNRFFGGSIDLWQIADDHIRDPGFGGPIRFVDIFALRITRFNQVRDAQTGQKSWSEAQSCMVAQQLKEIGFQFISANRRANIVA